MGDVVSRRVWGLSFLVEGVKFRVSGLGTWDVGSKVPSWEFT